MLSALAQRACRSTHHPPTALDWVWIGFELAFGSASIVESIDKIGSDLLIFILYRASPPAGPCRVCLRAWDSRGRPASGPFPPAPPLPIGPALLGGAAGA